MNRINRITYITDNIMYGIKNITRTILNFSETIMDFTGTIMDFSGTIINTTKSALIKIIQNTTIFTYKFYILRKNQIINSYNRCLPSEIKEIYMIEMNNDHIIRITTNLEALYQLINIDTVENTYFVFKVWNYNVLKTKEYILKEAILKELLTENITVDEFINKLYKYHGKYANNNIFSIMIDENDAMILLKKFKLSIAIPDNLTGYALVYYYYYINDTKLYNNTRLYAYTNYDHDDFKKSKIILIDYDLNEKEIKHSEYIVNSAEYNKKQD